mmetsp:Transcript_16021/g.23668  ORF Transcript_16021/g.23668 Transcript_16021/m.23668 type:complete len:108 (+) Transcript_16021:1103-1426(+)
MPMTPALPVSKLVTSVKKNPANVMRRPTRVAVVARVNIDASTIVKTMTAMNPKNQKIHMKKASELLYSAEVDIAVKVAVKMWKMKKEVNQDQPISDSNTDIIFISSF